MIFTYIPLVSIYNEQVGVATRKQYDVVLLGRKHPFVIFPRRLWLAASHVLISALLKINQLLVFRIALVSLLVRHKCHVHAVALWRIPSQRAIFTAPHFFLHSKTSLFNKPTLQHTVNYTSLVDQRRSDRTDEHQHQRRRSRRAWLGGSQNIMSWLVMESQHVPGFLRWLNLGVRASSPDLYGVI